MLKQVTLILLIIIKLSSSGDVLLLTPFASMSHKIIFTALASELGAKGHNVTLISTIKQSATYPNVTEITTPVSEILQSKFMNGFFKMAREGMTYSLIEIFGIISGKFCEIFFKTMLVQDWLQTGRRFDVVIVDGALSECFVSVAHLLSPAVVLMNTAVLFPWISIPTNVPTPYAYVPYTFGSFTSNMNFWQRLKNAFDHERGRLLWNYVMYPPMDEAVHKYFKNAKRISEALNDVSLVLVNGDAVLSPSRPEMPHIVNVAGLHIIPNQRLPEDLLSFVDSCDDSGVVLFSLGSIFDGVLTPGQISMFLTAFSKLKYQVIWKYKTKLENVPRNVKLIQWAPQQALLGHQKVRIFITHAGMLSLQEAFYYQVPTVTLPVFGDQRLNAAFLASKNLTVLLDWDNLNVDKVIEAVTRAAEDGLLRKNVERVSKIFKNVPEPPLKKAIYWLEYVMRHKGATHLQSEAKKMNIIQYFLIDILILLLICLFTIIFLFKSCFRHFRSRK